MAKFRIDIHRVEFYVNAVVVEAEDLDEAIKKVEAEWEKSDYLYEKTTDVLYDSETGFFKKGLAKQEDIDTLINID